MDLPLGLIVGVGLAASCGFRVFVPLLAMSLASATGHLHLAEGFEWIGSPAAMAAFGVATALEIAAYYIPAVDHLLDVVAAPAAVVAGTLATAACLDGMSPFMTWSVAAIAGGGSAATVQGLTTVTRLVSAASTGCLGNPLVATGEAGGSIALASLSLTMPLLAFLLAAALIGVTLRLAWGWIRRWRGRLEQAEHPDPLSHPRHTVAPVHYVDDTNDTNYFI